MTALLTRLNQIETRWTLVERAHGRGTIAVSARQHLLERYCGAVWRYLRALTRDESVAEDLFQEFALRMIRGDFHRATPSNGRFRSYLRSVAIHLVKDYYRGRKQQPTPLVAEPADVADDMSLESQSQDEFLDCWRAELLHRTWLALEQSNAALYALLRLHAADPDATASEKAEYLQRQSGQAYTANRVRVMLHRARQKFSQLLMLEVATSLDDPTEEELRQELRHLRLLSYCGG
jgi:RNA polymerase sigma-70 factor (ECF subfamily)